MVEQNIPQTAVTWVYEHSKHTGNVYQVLRTLAEAYNAKGACLSMKEIAHRTKVSQPTARRALEKLQADKTITIDRNGGEKRGTGITNCYRIPGFDTPLSHSDTPLSDDVTPGITQVTPPDLIPLLSSGVTPTVKSEPHTGAAGANKELLSELKEQKEFVEKQQTDSLKLKDTRANTPAQTETDLQDSLNVASPGEKAAYDKALFEANKPPVSAHQSNPPGFGQPPLPPAIVAAYKSRWGDPNESEYGKLAALFAGRTVPEVERLIQDCPSQYKQQVIGNPAGWLLKTTPAPVPASRSQTLPDYSISPGRAALNKVLGEAMDRKWREEHGQP